MFDASTTGGGALLWIINAKDDVSPEALQTIQPWAYLACGWTPLDETIAKSARGDCASQARWESYMLLLAVRTWAPIIFKSRGTLRLVGDALGVLQGAVMFRARDAMINAMFMEMALLVAPKGAE